MYSKKIFEQLNLISPSEERFNKYTYWGYNFEENYRLVNTGVLMRNRLIDEFPEHIARFINEQGQVIFIDNENGAILRSVREKRFLVLGKPIVYGLSKFSEDFQYGHPIVLVEGTIDRDFMGKIYKNTLGLLTSSVSVLQLELLKQLTNYVIIAYDNDEVGLKSRRSDYKKFIESGFKVKYLNWTQYKDFGDLADMVYRGQTWEVKSHVASIRTQMEAFLK